MAAADFITKVFIADDHPAFRQGLRPGIEAAPDLKLVGEAGDGPGALDGILATRPDVVALDVAMPRLNGFGVAERLREKKFAGGIIFLTMYDQEDMFNRAMNAGALGYILKDSAVEEIIDGIRAVAKGRHYLSPSISHFLMRRATGREALAKTTPGLADLTPTELKVLKMISEDKTSKEIADQAGVSHRTIETHRANISAKLNLHGSHSLLRFAFDHRDEL